MQEEPGAGRQEDVDTIDVGEPVSTPSGGDRAPSEDELPDLDERQRRIAEQRKPMGPPLSDTTERAEDRADAAPTGEPTDPDEQ